jgi:hypothetical protein
MSTPCGFHAQGLRLHDHGAHRVASREDVSRRRLSRARDHHDLGRLGGEVERHLVVVVGVHPHRGHGLAGHQPRQDRDRHRLPAGGGVHGHVVEGDLDREHAHGPGERVIAAGAHPGLLYLHERAPSEQPVLEEILVDRTGH